MAVKEYSLTSTGLVNTPGVLNWARNVYRSPLKKDRQIAVHIFTETYGLREGVVKGLLSGELPYEVKDDKVIFQVQEWTEKEVKEHLPPVFVKVNGNVVSGRISGRKNKLATVTVDNTVKGGQTPWYDWHVAWKTVVNCLNNFEPIVV